MLWTFYGSCMDWCRLNGHKFPKNVLCSITFRLVARYFLNDFHWNFNGICICDFPFNFASICCRHILISIDISCIGSRFSIEGRSTNNLKNLKTLSTKSIQDINRIRQDTLLPFRELQKRVLLLGRCQQANVLTKRVLRFLFDAKKLRNQVE